MSITQRLRNLVAVPSYHYHPAFAREVRQAFRTFQPTVVALELGAAWAEELEWGVGLWPSPVASHAKAWFLPIVPGDSIVEAYRLARQGEVQTALIDLDLASPIERHPACPLDGAFAPRLGSLFLETSDALEAAQGPPADGDVAREAHMAKRLECLMAQHERVLWVGGMAHWSRILRRLESGDFSGPRLRRARAPRSFERFSLGASALHRMTGQIPFSVSQYARDPERFDGLRSLHRLSLAAVRPDRFHASEVAAMLRYARNLAAQEGIQESPGLSDLLIAASATLGNSYTGRLANIALQDRFTPAAMSLPILVYSQPRTIAAFRSGKRVLRGQPLWAANYLRETLVSVPSPKEIERKSKPGPGASIRRARSGELEIWAGYPADDAAYEAFVRYVLEHARATDSDQATAVPFTVGMGEGLDVRATIRHWHEGEVYVREKERTPLRITNGLVDFTSSTEDSWILQRAGCGPQGAPYPDVLEGGWIDPQLQNAGSVSWQVRGCRVLQTDPFHLQVNDRELSLLTLDAPTWVRDETALTFYDHVIRPLVDLPPAESNLYSWLRIMFAFCRRKPFAYYSTYVPGPRVHSLAREFGVRVVHVPLRRIPKPMIEAHRSFRFMSLTRRQWHELVEQAGDPRVGWIPRENSSSQNL